MFNKKLEEKSWASKLYRLKYSGQKTDRGIAEGGGRGGGHNVPPYHPQGI